ncbi:hypothetical protein RFM68_29145 [Mesorhizobium sp. MSK_1335]|uniref:Uncharacterized protein n=1 Tax=Mesorhizobium montanum TaxID=3072323 RepID=A0ABU4ZVW2_9HYPH|nr:hypothetical protein [Mesorhizobium sp. MSK_1335]MDX8528552.1 hypothetical protein [Mesorhizobium sp. MSK_1335]
MTKLLNDMFIRRLAQIFLLSIGLIIVAICALFVVLAIQYNVSGFEVQKDAWKYVFMRVVSFPFDSSLGTFITGLSAIIPTMLASVCFKVRTDVTPFKSGPDLNRTGHVFVLILALGIALSVAAIFLVSTEDLSNVFTEATKDTAPKQLRGLFGAFLAIQGTYLSLLVKDKD